MVRHAQHEQHTVVSVDRVIEAPAAAIFAIVADAARHPEIDGSGQLVKAKDGAPRAADAGLDLRHVDEARRALHHDQHRHRVRAGPPHRLADRRWRDRSGRFLGGRIWRYELEPVDGGTKVTESWDISPGQAGFFLKNPKIGQHTAGVDVQVARPAGGLTESRGAGCVRP